MMYNQRRPFITKSNISHRISFIRGDHPEYGVLTHIVIAKDREAAIKHVLSCSYGEGTVIVNENEGEN